MVRAATVQRLATNHTSCSEQPWEDRSLESSPSDTFGDGETLTFRAGCDESRAHPVTSASPRLRPAVPRTQEEPQYQAQ